jgi:uncharacterized protein (TIGR02594 family)
VRVRNQKIIETALEYEGTRETPGTAATPVILEWFAAAGASWIRDDAEAWCSAFACGVALRAGAYNPRTVRAKKWLDIESQFAEVLEWSDIIPGDVIVLSRGPNLFHVTFAFEPPRATKLLCLGGNQSNMVRKTRYERKKFVGARRLAAALV